MTWDGWEGKRTSPGQSETLFATNLICPVFWPLPAASQRQIAPLPRRSPPFVPHQPCKSPQNTIHQQKAAGDGCTPRHFASVCAPDLCARFWTAPVLWRFRQPETASPRTMSWSRHRSMMRPLTKAEAQPRQGRHHCRIQWKQFPSSVRSGIIRRHNPIAVASNLRLGAKEGKMPPLTGL